MQSSHQWHWRRLMQGGLIFEVSRPSTGLLKSLFRQGLQKSHTCTLVSMEGRFPLSCALHSTKFRLRTEPLA